MKNHVLLVAACLSLTACLGYSAQDNTMIGQVKKAEHATPIICPNYKTADVSMGVMRNGVGSMSSQDVWTNVLNDDDFKLLTEATNSGALVKITYNEMRAAVCVPHIEVTHVELVK